MVKILCHTKNSAYYAGILCLMLSGTDYVKNFSSIIGLGLLKIQVPLPQKLSGSALAFKNLSAIAGHHHCAL